MNDAGTYRQFIRYCATAPLEVHSPEQPSASPADAHQDLPAGAGWGQATLPRWRLGWAQRKLRDRVREENELRYLRWRDTGLEREFLRLAQAKTYTYGQQ